MPAWYKTVEKNPPMKAHNATVPRTSSPTPDNGREHEDAVADYRAQIAFLQAMLSPPEDTDA